MLNMNYAMNWMKYKVILFSAVFLALSLVLGHFGTRWQVRITDRSIRNSLLEQAVFIANALDPQLIKELTFTEADEGSIAYEKIREQLIAYGQLINQRGIYSYILRDGEILFGPENYAEGDPMGEGPPGTVYEEPSPEDYNIFKTKKPVVMGPQTDEYGTFISAIAPVMDPLTDDVLMVIGIDILYESYEKILWKDKIRVLGMTLIIGLILITGIIINLTWNYRKDRLLRHLETYITAATGLLLTIMVSLLFYHQETQDRVKIFNNMFLSMKEDVNNNLWEIRHNMESAVRFFQSSETVEDQEFYFFNDPFVISSHVNWHQWIDHVPAEDLLLYEKYISQLFGTPFFVWENDEHGHKIPVTGRRNYYPIRQTAPKGVFDELSGFDLGSLPEYNEELFFSITRHLLTPFALMPIFTPDSDSIEIVIIKSGFKQENIKYSMPLSTNILGFVSANIKVNSILSRAEEFTLESDTVVHIHLVDPHTNDGIKPLTSYPKFSSNSCLYLADVDHSMNDPFYKAFPLFMFGKPFALIVHPTDAFFHYFPYRITLLVFLGGLLFTVILTLIIGYIRNREVRLEKLVENQTQELHERMKELACLAAVRAQTQGHLNKASMLKVIHYVKQAMQYPEIAFPVIELNGQVYSNGKINIQKNHSISSLIRVGKTVYGKLWVLYTRDVPFQKPEEENLIKSVSEIIGFWHERKILADREAHTKKVLMGIRNVNQLIVKENDLIALIRTACSNLTETLGYFDAWISILDKDNNITLTEFAGNDVCGFESYKDQITNQSLPACIQQVLKTQKFINLSPFNHDCHKCPYLSKEPGFAIYSAPLSHQDRLYGVLTVSVSREYSDLKEEQNLFVEVAEDIGFALYKIEMEEQRKESEIKILKNLHEKEILLQEIHHRVKNNLNVISSLLKLQARRITSKDEAIEAFSNSSNRILAMALVHKKLYDTKDFDRVEMNTYLTSLASQLLSAYGHQVNVKISTEAEDVVLDINTAVPCGLILNELISNTLKHAFTDRKMGMIHIKAEYSENNDVVLSVKDDGIGFPENFDINAVDTLGLHLVKLLTNQLNGTLSIQNDKGSLFIIKFPRKTG